MSLLGCVCVCLCCVCAFFQAEWFLGTVHRGRPQSVVLAHSQQQVMSTRMVLEDRK